MSLLRAHAEGFVELPGEQPFEPAIASVPLPAGVRCGAPDLIEYRGEVEILLSAPVAVRGRRAPAVVARTAVLADTVAGTPMSNSTDFDPARADRFVSRVGEYLMRLPPASIGTELKALREARASLESSSQYASVVSRRTCLGSSAGSNPALATILAYLHALDASAELHVSFADGTQIALPLPAGQH